MNRKQTIEIWKPYVHDLKEINGMLCGIETWLFTWSVSYGFCDLYRKGRFCFDSLQNAKGFFENWDGIEKPVVCIDGCTAIK